MAPPPSAGVIVECTCKRRYMRTVVRLDTLENDHVRCVCGDVLGAWNGSYRLRFEPEDAGAK